MNVTQLCKKAGITRQWLNQLVDRDGVPGVSRQENDRLQIADSSALQQWIAERSRQTAARNKTRERLRLDRSTVKPPLDGGYTARELADIVECTESSIRSRVLDIPEAYLDDTLTYVFNKKLGRKMRVRNVYRFRDTPGLREWIRRERETKEKGRKARKFRKFSHNPVARVGKCIQTLKMEWNRALKVSPLQTWDDMFLKNESVEFESVLRPILDELKRRNSTPHFPSRKSHTHTIVAQRPDIG
jgi:hypothetical protein